jgi:hypothetical protein
MTQIPSEKGRERKSQYCHFWGNSKANITNFNAMYQNKQLELFCHLVDY